MRSVFEKLNHKNHSRIVVLNAPPSFEPEITSLRDVTILRDLTTADGVTFFLAFVTRQQEVDSLARTIAGKSLGDAIVWFAYPKGTSKKYKSEISRDQGWQALGDAGFEPVKSVAIDEDWSGVRFRRVDFIKKMTRDPSHRLTSPGKAEALEG